MSSSSSSERDRRIQTDMTELLKKNFQVKLTDENKLDQLEVVFRGPKESPYEDGFWKINVDIPREYPSKPPKLTFMNKVFHPNISRFGYVCVNLLSENWDPLYGLVQIFDQIIPQLLREPNPEDANNADAAALLLNQDKQLFEQTVRGEETVVHELHYMAFQQQKEYCAQYAKMEDIQSESSSGDEGSRSSQDQTPGHANP